jgi:hypothetical protein
LSLDRIDPTHERDRFQYYGAGFSRKTDIHFLASRS